MRATSKRIRRPAERSARAATGERSGLPAERSARAATGERSGLPAERPARAATGERRDLTGERPARRWTAALVAILAFGCAPAGPAPRAPDKAAAAAGEAAKAPPPAATESVRREQPPPSGAARLVRMPPITWAELSNGVRSATVVSRAAPLVEVRVIIPGGAAADGERTGLAALTGELLLHGGAGGLSGRELLSRVESLGATLWVDAGLDATVFGLRAPREHLAAALELLGHVIQRPRFDLAGLNKRRARAMEAASDRATTDGRWGARMILFRDLYALPAELHPYGSYAATAAELSKITAADCRAFHSRWYVPKNTVVVVAGDTTPEAARAAVEKAFPDRRGDEPPVLSFTDPVRPESLKITIIDRPKSTHSEVYLGLLGPARGAPEWPAFAVASQVLGGPSGRLSQDLVERRKSARAASSSPLEVAHGPVPLVVHGSTVASRTGLVVEALLSHAEQLATAAPSQEEVEAAARQIRGGLERGLETLVGLADEITRMQVLELPDDYHDGYRKELRDLTPILAGKAAGDHVRPARAALVVVGDAQVIGPMLSRHGDVKVVDPTAAFERKRTIPRSASAPVDPARPPSGVPRGSGPEGGAAP